MKVIPYSQYNSSLIKRLELLAKCKEDKNKSDLLALLAQKQGGLLLFAQNLVWTRKDGRFFDQEIPEHIPFMPFEYQVEFFNQAEEAIWNNQHIFIEKSRQMGFSWMLCVVAIYFWLIHGKSTLIVANKMEDVDSLGDINSIFEKVRYIIRYIPTWLLPDKFSKDQSTLYNKYALISRSDSTAVMAGDSSGTDAGRGGTYDIVIFDEMASTKNAKQMNTALSATTRTMIYNSTPKGKLNEYYEVRKRAYADLDFATKNVVKSRFEICRCHWSEHPCYDREWYNALLREYDNGTVAQEYDIDYSAQVANRVYPDFEEPNIKVGVFEYNYQLPLYCSIDNSHGGADPHAFVFWQVDKNGIIYCIESLEFPGKTDIDTPASLLARKPVSGYIMPENIREWYDRYMDWKTPIFIADPYDTDTTHNNSSIRSIYASHGINLITPNISKGLDGNIAEQIRITKKITSRMRIDKKAETVLLSMTNAMYPQRKEGSQATNPILKPIHDWTSHTRTAVEYFCLWLNDWEKQVPIKQDLVYNNSIYATASRRQNKPSPLDFI